MIAVENLHKAYGGQVALDEVTFRVPKGEIFGFVGLFIMAVAVQLIPRFHASRMARHRTG